MADWTPMRHDLREDPAVLGIAAELEMDIDTVVGKLHRVWSWFSIHTTNGKSIGLSGAQFDALAGKNGFASAMEKVGWLVEDGATMCLPNFRRWNAQTAKERLLTQRRVQRYRARQRNASGNGDGIYSGVSRTLPRQDKTSSRQDKRREDKTAPLSPAAFSLDSGEFAACLPSAGDSKAVSRGKCITLLNRVGVKGDAAVKLADRADCDPAKVGLVVRAMAHQQQRGKLKRTPAAYVTWAINADDWKPPGGME